LSSLARSGLTGAPALSGGEADVAEQVDARDLKFLSTRSRRLNPAAKIN
jgi:hypothetical protein